MLRGVVDDTLDDRDVKPLVVSGMRDRLRDGSDLVARILHLNVGVVFSNEI